MYLKLLLTLFIPFTALTQSDITINVNSFDSIHSNQLEYGIFYVPKTTEAQNDFLSNNEYLNCIRLHVIESALNSSSNLNDCLALLDNASPILQNISNKTDKVLFIIEKMPAWLSSSSDPNPAQTPGWFVLNTKPPANYNDWNAAINAITNRIWNSYGITNAYFEIWNEPDLGSWTGTEEEYFKLFQNTYDAIKLVNNSIPVGGVATNSWGNNIYRLAPAGYLKFPEADSSLIANIIDSSIQWNKPLDFISWHNFSLDTRSIKNARDFIQSKYISHNQSSPELIISEWNTPSSVRDTPLQKSFAIKHLMASANYVDNHVIAAWQDFSQSTNEFHNDYGLLTYGSIHKPVYKAIQLAQAMKGQNLNISISAPIEVTASKEGDSLFILIANYCPPPLVSALNECMHNGFFNLNDLDSAGYIDISTNNINPLDSIFKGLISIPNNNFMSSEINNAINVYQHYDSLQNTTRFLNLQIPSINGNNTALISIINSEKNNSQFLYDSLINNGYSQAGAVNFLNQNQTIKTDTTNINNNTTLQMQANEIRLLKIYAPEITSLTERKEKLIHIYPNPNNGELFIEGKNTIGRVTLLNSTGKIVWKNTVNSHRKKVEISSFEPGVYILQFHDYNLTEKIIIE